MRNAVVGALLGCAVLASGCSDDPEPAPQEAVVEEAPAPVYDPTLAPAAAAMALVPADATVLVVTDYDELRLRVQQAGVTGESSARERRRFARTVERRAVLFSPGLLRAEEDLLLRDYGFTQDDVAWEARFVTPAGDGYVLKMRDGLDLTGVVRAVEEGVAPLAGAELDTSRALLSVGATDTPADSWAALEGRLDLAGQGAGTTYVDTSCVAPDDLAQDTVGLTPTQVADADELDELQAFSVSYGTELVTVRLGAQRNDVFDRARLVDALSDGEFARTYRDPVADPSGGRIGYRLGDPDVAERLVRERQLPFAVCVD